MSIATEELEFSIIVTGYSSTACTILITLATTPNQTKELQKLYPGKFNEGLQFTRTLAENLPENIELYKIIESYLINCNKHTFYNNEFKIPETILTIKGTIKQILNWKKEYKIQQ